MTDDGSVVVGLSVSGNNEAFIFDDASGIRPIKSVLENDLGLDLTGWTLFEATGISGNGNVIVGSGINPSGFQEGWIAIVPEPSTNALLFGITALGLAFVFRRRSRTTQAGR